MICKILAISILATSPDAINDVMKLRDIGFSYELKNMASSGRIQVWEPYDAHVVLLDSDGCAVKVRIMENGKVYWTRGEHDLVCGGSDEG